MMRKIFAVMIILLLFLFITYGCFSLSGQRATADVRTTEPIVYVSPTNIEITETLAPIVTSVYSPIEEFTSLPIVTIGVTQIPVELSTKTKEDGDYLYKNVIVTLRVDSTNDEAISYINLDNLNDNGMLNSDVEWYVGQGKITAYFFFPTNNAKIYFSGGDLDFASCVDHLSEFADKSFDYFRTGMPTCVLTNEGRIAIVNYVKNSFRIDKDDHIISTSIKVTVFNQIVK